MRVRRPPTLVLLCAVAALGLALLHADQLRSRASAALGRGMPAREAELARGFVLGEDERIDPATVEDFRRAGLSHLLAVSGQNVALLALLAMPLLAALGMPLHTRLVWVLGLIAVYVPLAGAGPSIQRAATMGALAVLATLAGRRASRFYALTLAAVLTLAIDPGIAADVGWQLSFAAVLGILLLAAPLREAIVPAGVRGPVPRTFAEGAAMTIAATLATAPLIAFHFGELSTTTLVANLLALPAVAPAMWLGMLAGAAGQLPGFPVEVFNRLDALLLAYIAQVASWCGDPAWAYLHVDLSGGGLIASYAALGVGAVGGPWFLRRRRIAALRRTPVQATPRCNAFAMGWGEKTLHHRGRRRVWIAMGVGVAAVALVWSGRGGGADAAVPATGLRIEVLDVGQGDAILLQAAGAPPILVDGGPPGDGLAEKLAVAGVERLGAAVLTHDQSDHAGGAADVLDSVAVERLVLAAPAPRLEAIAAGEGAEALRLAEGGQIRSGHLRLTALWPPRELLGMRGADPNQLSLVLLAEWRHLSILLTGDAEAHDVPLDPGPVDLLKVAHHGSDDEGLEALLDHTSPKLALLSVGENSYGHPAPGTLAGLAEQGVPVARTDERGEIAIEADARGWRLSG